MRKIEHNHESAVRRLQPSTPVADRPAPGLDEIIARHKAGAAAGITSVCSAHPLVLAATMLQSATTGGAVLVEATSNQVDQTGGYTGMRPPDFRELVLGVADRCGVPRRRVILGGDHLGPNRWRAMAPDAAMTLAEELVAAYAAAGFTKLHLDCSMACAGDPEPVGDHLASSRAARLVRVAEATAPDPGSLRYVIGTEVPVPGGAAESIGELMPTAAEAALATLAAHRAALADAGLPGVWPRICALVVQPGVEFDEWDVVDYVPGRTTSLQRVLDGEPGIVFEAHSTDYQTPSALAELVRDHWAVLKVGPALTFALREALFALAAIEDELVAGDARSGLRATLEQRMLAEPGYWDRYHGGDDATRALARVFSYSDRARYYWPAPALQDAQARLFANLGGGVVPLPLLHQHLPAQYARVRAGELSLEPRELVIDHVRDVLRVYAAACGGA